MYFKKKNPKKYKPKLRLFRTRNLFYYRNIVLYYRKYDIFDNIKNIIAILDALHSGHENIHIVKKGFIQITVIFSFVKNIELR